MSYADAHLDLTSVSVACLTGLNGSGKSALLDAITWTLWESARAPSDELVRLGQTEMWVDLLFTLEDHVYRVRRARQKSYGRGGQQTSSRGNLDLQVWDGSPESWLPRKKKNGISEPDKNPKWISLTAASMRETQKRLRDILRMDYETFITSVYLRQGRADEFTMRSPNERKQVFSDILGLDYFDTLQEKCREEARECKGRVQILEAGLSARSNVERDFQDSCADIEQIEMELQSVRLLLQESAEKRQTLDEEIAKANYLQIRAETAKARTQELRSDSQSLQRRAEDLLESECKLLALVAQADLILELNRQFEECKELAESMDFKATAFSELHSRRLELRSRLAMFQGRMEVELEHSKSTLLTKKGRQEVLFKSCKDAEKLESAYQEYRRLLDAELDMSKKREAFSTLNMRADELQSMIAEARVRLEAQNQQKECLLEELQSLLSARQQFEQEQTALKKELLAIDQCETEFEMVEEKGLKLKSQIEALHQQVLQLKKYIRSNEEKMHELCETPDLSNCPLCRSLIADSKAVLDRYENDNLNAQIEIDSLETQIGELSNQRDELRKQYIELRKKIEQRKNLDIRIGEFNERKTALDRAEATREELGREIAQSRSKLESNMFAPIEKESLIRVRAELAKIEFDPIVFSSFQAQMRSQRHIEFRYQQILRDLKELTEIESELPILAMRVSKMESDLASGNFGPLEKREIEKLDKSIAELDYDKSMHQNLKHQLVELLPHAEQARDLRKAQEQVPDIQKAAAEITQMLEARLFELHKLEEEADEWCLRLEQLPAMKDELDKVNELIQTLELQKEDLHNRHLVLQARLQQMKEDKSELDSKAELLSQSIKEMSEYNQLAEAFGKKGIQAIIIENAIPEIEAEANRILARLTDNRMHMALLTQQRTRQGNPIETLEIIIADELGTRSYELYSGGEAFRVNFALRVAMSRLLARRAGARLETLIIDEGFGSQDEQSRTKMIQAIASIKPDFARIIVVTHIAEVKEMFPVQIAVEKEEGLSKISLHSWT